MTNPKHLLIRLCLFLLFLGTLVPAIQTAQKQVSASIKVWPVKIEPLLKTGEAYKTEINVRNTAKYRAKITLEVQDFTRDEEGDYNFYASGQRQTSFSAANWISLPAKQYYLEPSQEIKIPLKISTPKTAEAGGHYAIAFVEATPIFDKSSIKGSYILGKARVGILNLITIKGKIIKKSDVNFSISRFNFSPTVPFTITFNNRGNVHRDLAGILRIDSLGKKLNISERSALPKSNSIIKDKLVKMPLFGSYKAKLFIATKDGGKWQKERTFYLIPLKLILGIIVALVILTVLVILFRKRFSIKIESKVNK